MASLKSAINEVKDQLFLDSADGKYLTTISNNLGLNRPKIGFSNDAIWRAVVRELAVDYKQVITVFYELLAIIFGPKASVGTCFNAAVVVDDTEVYISDWMCVPQRGVFILDSGLATEETVEYTLRDPITGLVTLDTAITQAHASLGTRAVSHLSANVIAAAVAITVDDGSIFPDPATVGSYPLIIDPGTLVEEIVTCSAKTGNVLTVSALAFDHTGPSAGFATTAFVKQSSDRMLVFGDDLTAFDETGIILIQESGGSPQEFALYSSLSLADKVFDLKAPLTNIAGTGDSFSVTGTTVTLTDSGANFQTSDVGKSIVISNATTSSHNGTYTIASRISSTQITWVNGAAPPTEAFTGGWKILYSTNASITKAKYGAEVQVAQVLVQGIGWDVFQTEQRKIKIYIPPNIQPNRLVDAPFLHDTVGSPPSTTLATGASIGDLSIEVADSTGFPESGVIEIDAGGTSELISYSRYNNFYAALRAGFAVGVTKFYVDDATSLYRGFYDYKIPDVIVGEGTANVETLAIVSVSLVDHSITTAACANTHAFGNTLRVGDPNVLFLDRPLESAHLATVAVDVYRVYLAGYGDLEDGRIFTADHTRFQGKYLWSFLERVAESSKTTLAENISGPTSLVIDQQGARTALEVKDASLFNTSTLPEINIGRNMASFETRQVNDITLRASVLGATLGAGATAGASSLTITAGFDFPEANGYRVFVGNTIPGAGTGEEIVVVTNYNPSTHVLTLEQPLVHNHSNAEVISLMADVLTVDALTNDQTGQIPYSQRYGLVPAIGTEWASSGTVGNLRTKVAAIEELRSYVNVTSAAASAFVATGTYVKLNFGRNKPIVRSQLSTGYAAGVTAVVVTDGSSFPAATFHIVLGEGTREAESFIVTTRSSNTLNLPTATIYPHKKDEWVVYPTGDHEEVYYNSKTTGGLERLNFSPSIVFAGKHLSGEAVTASRVTALPSKYGTDWPFYLPSSWVDRLQYIFDLARAAGVEVIVINDR